jgi:acyl transferase domain-containing protein
MFPGHGHQHMDMGRELYETEAVFRETVDQGLEYLRGELDFDLRSFLYPGPNDSAEPSVLLERPAVFQPAVFLVDFAVARLWQSWGIEPAACIGHSLGEYVAACVSGVLSYQDALRIVCLRGRLMEKSPDGAMLAISLPENQLSALLESEDGIWLSAVNAPSLCLVSGEPARISAFEERLTRDGVECSRVAATHAYHSGLMEGGVRPLVEAVAKAKLGPIKIPFVSNLTGDWIKEGEARDPEYWGLHLREPVRFAQGMERILRTPDQVLLEVGPGQIMTSLARMHDLCDPGRVLISSMRHPKAEVSDAAVLTGALARVWTAGVRVNWRGYYEAESRHRAMVPTYPFQRQRYWIDRIMTPVERGADSPGARRNIADWYYTRTWRRTRLAAGDSSTAPDRSAAAPCIAFVDGSDFARSCVDRLEGGGRRVIQVMPGSRFERAGDRISVDPRSQGDYLRLVDEVTRLDGFPAFVVHLWGTKPAPPSLREDDALAEELQYQGFFSLYFLIRALGETDTLQDVPVFAVTEGVQVKEPVIVTGATLVADGQLVRIIPPPPPAPPAT